LYTEQKIIDAKFDPKGTFLQRVLENSYDTTTTPPTLLHVQGTYQWVGNLPGTTQWVLYSQESEFVTHAELEQDLAPVVMTLSGQRSDTAPTEGQYLLTYNNRGGGSTVLDGIAPTDRPIFTGILTGETATFTGNVLLSSLTNPDGVTPVDGSQPIGALVL
jgi:hypothetical protein